MAVKDEGGISNTSYSRQGALPKTNVFSRHQSRGICEMDFVQQQEDMLGNTRWGGTSTLKQVIESGVETLDCIVAMYIRT